MRGQRPTAGLTDVGAVQARAFRGAGACIRDMKHAYSKDGGLAVLYGNIAPEGCIVKTAGVDAAMFEAEALRYTTSVPTSTIRVFTGTARICESQEAAVTAILTDQIKPGDVVLIRYEGPKGGPGMQEMLYPTSYLKSKGLGKSCALITDGRFSGGTSPKTSDRRIGWKLQFLTLLLS